MRACSTVPPSRSASPCEVSIRWMPPPMNAEAPIHRMSTASRIHRAGPRLSRFMSMGGRGPSSLPSSGDLVARYPLDLSSGPDDGGCSARAGGSVAVDVRRERADERQVAVLLRVVEPVADDELRRDVEADVAHVDVDLGRLGLAQQRRDLDRRGTPR